MLSLSKSRSNVTVLSSLSRLTTSYFNNTRNVHQQHPIKHTPQYKLEGKTLRVGCASGCWGDTSVSGTIITMIQ